MNFVFFDVECANCYNSQSKICSFGYVVTDENFKVLKKEDILIDPNSEFQPYVLKHVIHYKEEDFLDKPRFNMVYNTIKDFLTNPKYISFGFDVANDLKFINDECKRYKKPKIKAVSYDIQAFYEMYVGKLEKKSLSGLAQILNIDTSSLTEHNSRDDAMITMLIMKEIANKLNVNGIDLIYLCEKSFVSN
jgi:DNA polymerase III epsilon subunit-like protein